MLEANYRTSNPSCGLATGLVWGVDENEQGEFEHEAGGLHGVNALGKRTVSWLNVVSTPLR
jgi:hypothetical protein